MWTLLQLAIVTAVLFSNAYWSWTPNGYLAAMIAIGSAVISTWAISKLIDLLRVRRGKLPWRSQRLD
jgi:hypothetical protein